jgi:large subunit ribosomal protein L5
MSAKKAATSKTQKTKAHAKKTKTASKKKAFQAMKPHIAKVTVNIGVGEAGEKLKKAESVLEGVTKQKPVQTLSKTTNKDWGLRKFMPIGCKVTLRKKAAEAFLLSALKIRENKISEYSFDNQGNFSFGVPDHTLFEGQKYDPNIGIFGMDICVTVENPGYRIRYRRIDTRKIPHRHQLTREATMKFIADTYHVEVVE